MAGYRKRAREWSRAAFGLAALFASMGVWGFEGAWGMAAISLMAGLYFHVAGRRHARLADPASLLLHAHELAARGRVEEARALVEEILRLSPWFAEAREYRGALEAATAKSREDGA